MMITNYDLNSIYQIFEVGDNSKKYKIGEIESGIFYDVDKNGKRIGKGFRFSNTQSFWCQFNRIHVKKIEKPLGGFEYVAYGAYWTISLFISLVLIIGANSIDGKIFWLIASVIHFGFTIYFRNNKFVTYWMAFASIIVILLLLTGKQYKKKSSTC